MSNSIIISIINIINNESSSTIYKYNNQYYDSYRKLYNDIIHNNYINITGKNFKLLLDNKDNIRELYNNVTILNENYEKLTARTAKYVDEYVLLYRKGHTTVSIKNPNTPKFNFNPSNDKFEIIKIGNDNYMLNSEIIGTYEKLLHKLNELGVDITIQQFFLIHGHHKIPTSISTNYPNLSYSVNYNK